MPFGMGFGELVLILVIVVVVFGATKLPELGGGIGDAIQRLREQQQRPLPSRLLLRRTPSSRWSPLDWLLVIAAIAAIALVIANALLRATSRS